MKTLVNLRLLGLSMMASWVAQPALAQQSVEDIIDEEALLEEIIVTGTRRLDRTVADSAVPIDVLNVEAMNRTGYTETNLILSTLVPSFNFPLPSITDGTDHIRPATLRGLAPDHTLVLVNGKRRHSTALLNINGSVGRGSSAVDMNMIPSSAIQRVEVLRDGASAQYGSDAIAGVINVVLKDESEGGSLSASYGQFDTEMEGVPSLRSVSIAPDGSLQFAPGADREVDGDGETLTISGNIGFNIAGDGFLHLSGQYRDRDPTNRSGWDPRQQFDALPNGDTDPREETFDRINHRFGNSSVQDLAIFYNAGIPLTSDIELYSFGSLGTRDGESGGFYRRSLDSRNVVEIYPAGFLPLITTDISDRAFAGGLRGEFNDWNWDLSVVDGRNQLDYGVINSLNASLGPTSPTEFDAGGLEFNQVTVNFDVYRLAPVSWLPNDLATAFGAEFRNEQYSIRAGEPASYITGILRDENGDPILDDNGNTQAAGPGGSQVFPGFQPSNEIKGDRDNFSVYVELDTDLADEWNVALAGRYEDYSDFGSTFNGKLATRWGVSDTVSLRGALSTGFRAPSLAQQFFTTTSTNFIDGVPFEIGTFPVESATAQALGADPLDAEESVNISAGIVWQPLDNLNITLDLYQIEIDDRIVLSENLTGDEVVALLENAGIFGVTGARFFINGVDTETKGFDLIATYDIGLDQWGSLRLTAGYNQNETEITGVAPNPPELEALGPDLVRFSRREQARFEEGTPDNKLNLSANWVIGGLTATLRTTRYGETVDPGTTPEADEKLSEKWITDLDLQYDFNETVTVAVGANNLFDEYPDASPTGPGFSTFNQIFPYSGFSPFGFNGRYMYARLTANF